LGGNQGGEEQGEGRREKEKGKQVPGLDPEQVQTACFPGTRDQVLNFKRISGGISNKKGQARLNSYSGTKGFYSYSGTRGSRSPDSVLRGKQDLQKHNTCHYSNHDNNWIKPL
jgi:hypothetical protein